MNTLVTGGTGFLGRKLVERLLLEGRHVVVLGRTPSAELEARGVRFIKASLTDTQLVRDACKNIETVFHVAARVGVWGQRADFFRTNVLGTRTVLEGCRAHGVKRLIFTSTPSVVYNGGDLAGVDESLPLTTDCPSPYPLTKATAECEVLAANSPALRTVALRPHLMWGVGDPHLVPRILARAREGRLRIVGSGTNRVDMVHVENAVDAHLLAEAGLGDSPKIRPNIGGRAFFITNGEPVVLWDWINGLLKALGRPQIQKRISLRSAQLAGMILEGVWQLLPLEGEPPMTRFIAAELARNHWFDISAARRDLGYKPRVSMADGMVELIASLKT